MVHKPGIDIIPILSIKQLMLRLMANWQAKIENYEVWPQSLLSYAGGME